MTARELLQNQLKALNADLEANPAIIDPRIAQKAELEAALATPEPWYDIALEDVKAFIAKYLP